MRCQYLFFYAFSDEEPELKREVFMCGRIDQNETAQFYAHVFGWSDAVYDSQSGPESLL
jgi:hypothetical protein